MSARLFEVDRCAVKAPAREEAPTLHAPKKSLKDQHEAPMMRFAGGAAGDLRAVKRGEQN